MGLGIGAVGAIFYSVSGTNIELSVRTTKEDTKIYSSDGVELASLFQEEHRERVPLESIPPNLRNATIAIEDSRFYQHSGVDIRGILRALQQNIRYHQVVQGGSTITQQLARNVYLTRRKTLTRKLQEAALAIRIESQYPKDYILEVYLNQVYYGSGAYGVQTASRIYFGKDVKDLNLAECALLAGMPKRPSSYSPFVDIAAARRRRDTVLDRMAELGYITEQAADEAKREPIRLASKKPIKRPYRAGYFVDYVVGQLIDRYGEELVTSGGLRVYTTLNWRMQQTAQRAVAEGVARAKHLNVGQGALIAIEAKTGHIKAMVGGTNYFKTQFNRTVQGPGRQPGSAFKAFVYTAAIDRGVVTPDYVIKVPGRHGVRAGQLRYPDGKGGWWTPRNYDGRYYPSATVRKAVAKSINVQAIKVAEMVGIEEVIKYAHLMGIKSELEPYMPLAIGGIKGIHPIEMAAAYAVFASGGIYAEPMAVTKITDTEGGVIEENQPQARRVLSEKTVAQMDELFREVVTAGTGRAVRDVPGARGKTGTTNEDRDAWFVGYIPDKIATAVWVGNDDYRPMRHVWGGNVCAPIWREFTLEALRVYREQEAKSKSRERRHLKAREVGPAPPAAEPAPEPTSEPAEAGGVVRVTICAESQLLATKWCPSTYQDTFTADAAPDRYCNIHGPPEALAPAASRRPQSEPEAKPAESERIRLTVCADTGKIATRFCPRKVVKTFTIRNAPTDVCDVHQQP